MIKPPKSILDILEMKGREKIAVLTGYDFPTARILDEMNLDMVLVGDSLGEVLYGFPNTTLVDMLLMLRHVKAVRLGLKKTHLMADMPFASYDEPNEALTNAVALKRAGADSVKLENPTSEVVRILVENDIAVFGHVGLTPQTIHDYKKQGKDAESAKRILDDSLRLEAAGCFGMLIEAVPDELAREITSRLAIPTVGIAAGPHCDGQVLVFHDVFGYEEKERSYSPKRAFIREALLAGGKAYVESVKN
jgi:3-methyl-2-oxobutanoate hydroxymethyltransferase